VSLPNKPFQKTEMPKLSLSQNELPQLGRTLRIGIPFRLMLSRVAGNARLHSIYIIDTDNLTAEEIDPETYAKNKPTVANNLTRIL
jgi:hypothetical protein